ncbi:hypothetical protein DRJ79_14665 [Enterococcus faecalis]|nr:Hypothetical protein [Enterococcus faecalis]AMM74542.1 hypothetical protein [Enterococcus faecalis]AMM74564.1 hypothetical protein [Enterococcus faecalis]AMM74611.1 hypothetical protein [Enterococcus faecalis]AWH58921.1 hypothetical protein [Enterococcus faecalis]
MYKNAKLDFKQKHAILNVRKRQNFLVRISKHKSQLPCDGSWLFLALCQIGLMSRIYKMINLRLLSDLSSFLVI